MLRLHPTDAREQAVWGACWGRRWTRPQRGHDQIRVRVWRQRHGVHRELRRWRPTQWRTWGQRRRSARPRTRPRTSQIWCAACPTLPCPALPACTLTSCLLQVYTQVQKPFTQPVFRSSPVRYRLTAKYRTAAQADRSVSFTKAKKKRHSTEFPALGQARLSPPTHSCTQQWDCG